jgi:adenosylcobyric acid synthase
VRVRWVRSSAELGRPDVVVLPGSKATRSDLDWFRRSGLAAAVERSGATIVAVCAGLQMCGLAIDDPGGAEGPPGTAEGLGWLPVTTDFEAGKVLDRPSGRAVGGPGLGERVAGYRIHHGRVRPVDGTAVPWLVASDGSPLGFRQDLPAGSEPGFSGGRGPVVGATLHALFEDDGFRSGVLTWVAERAGKSWQPSGVSFAATRTSRLDRIADTLEAHLDLDRIAALIAEGAPEPSTTPAAAGLE